MWKEVQRFWRLLAQERASYAVGMVALFVVNLCDVSSPVFMAVAVDLTEAALTGAEPKSPKLLEILGWRSADFTLFSAVSLYLAMHVAANVARYPMLMYVAVPSHRIGQRLRNQMADHLLKLPRSFYDRSKSGDLMSLATSDVGAVRMALGSGVLVGVDTLYILTMVILVLLGLSWKLTLITMVTMPVIAWITNKLSHAEFNGYEAVQEDLGDLTERVRESYAGIRIIQGYAREGFDRARFLQYSERHLEKNLRLSKIKALFDPTLDLMLGISTVLVLIFGGLEVVRGESSLGSFVAFLFLVRYLSGPMIGFGWTVSLFQRGRASLGRLEQLLGEPLTIQDAPHAREAVGAGALEVRGLSFDYAGPRVVEEPDAPKKKKKDAGKGDEGETPAVSASAGAPVAALREVSVTVEAGKTLGVFGPVGSGKSTLASLLARLYEPPEGTVFLDGVDVRDLKLSSLRQAVVVAPQETFLFSDTVARNILLGAPGGKGEVERCARLAHLHDEIMGLEKGYETLLGERGVNLSGGQRQRLAIARAVATDPKVLVLDDCLSAVDARTEEAILGSLRDVFEGRTGVIISHRVRAVQHCDEILVLEGGRATARGTHEALMAQGGYYARVAQEQQREAAQRASRDAGGVS
jgi:ATP-binding cassette subfamily B multidrug efflux pump